VDNIFLQFAVVLSLASLFGYLVMKLKLPLVVAYLLAGVCLSIVSIFDLHHAGIFTFLPEIGIAFVLFLIGMELDLREIKALGKPIITASLGQIVLSALAGFAVTGVYLYTVEPLEAVEHKAATSGVLPGDTGPGEVYLSDYIEESL
jgi:Kef-type K+ transport system membrane component KefB